MCTSKRHTQNDVKMWRMNLLEKEKLGETKIGIFAHLYCVQFKVIKCNASAIKTRYLEVGNNGGESEDVPCLRLPSGLTLAQSIP